MSDFILNQAALDLHTKYRRGEEGGVRISVSWRQRVVIDANLRGANLRGADLSDANLSGADLSDANLSDANLSGADLSDANLRGANLSGANLSGANLSGAKWSKATKWGAPTMLLLAWWGYVSKPLCRDLMRFDAENCPDGTRRFAAWKKTEVCPYRDVSWQRAANFEQDAHLWKPGKAPSALKLAMRLLKEKCKEVK